MGLYYIKERRMNHAQTHEEARIPVTLPCAHVRNVEGLANNTPDNEMNALALSNYQLCKAAKYDGARQYQGRLVAFVEGYGVTIPLLAGGYLCGSYNGPLTENMTLYESSINEALTAAMVKVVMGEDISVYEDAVATWYANGGEAITEEVNDYYQSNK